MLDEGQNEKVARSATSKTFIFLFFFFDVAMTAISLFYLPFNLTKQKTTINSVFQNWFLQRGIDLGVEHAV